MLILHSSIAITTNNVSISTSFSIVNSVDEALAVVQCGYSAEMIHLPEIYIKGSWSRIGFNFSFGYRPLQHEHTVYAIK